MNWKFTGVLAVLLGIAGAAYLLYNPHPPPPTRESIKVFGDVTADQVSRIEIARAGDPPLWIERERENRWRVGPPGRPADGAVVNLMLYGLDRLERVGALEPARPESAPSVTGMDTPRLRVTFRTPKLSAVVRFGKAPPTGAGAVFFQREGDPRIYLAAQDTFEACNKGISQIRSRKFADFNPQGISRMVLERKFIVARSREDSRGKAEYERSVLSRGREGWVLEEPWKEKFDDMRIQQLLADVSELTVEDWGGADPKAQGMEEPQVILTLTPHGQERPIVFRFGDPVGREGAKNGVWAQIEGTGESAILDGRLYGRLPLQRNGLRSNVLFPMDVERVREFAVEERRLGRVRLERRPPREGKAGPPEWKVVEPADVRVDGPRVGEFVGTVLRGYRIKAFLGEQPDLKLFNLDPPDVTVAVKMEDGTKHLYGFGLKENSEAAYAWKDGFREVFEVRVELFRILRRLELNFRHPEVFSVPRESLREFLFEARNPGALQPIYYRMRWDEADKKWKFADEVLKARPPDEDRVNALLAGMNSIKAEDDHFVGRGPDLAAKYKLVDGQAPARLEIQAEQARAILYISEDLSEVPGRHVYFARFEGSPLVFELRSGLVESLKRPPVKKPSPD